MQALDIYQVWSGCKPGCCGWKVPLGRSASDGTNLWCLLPVWMHLGLFLLRDLPSFAVCRLAHMHHQLCGAGDHDCMLVFSSLSCYCGEMLWQKPFRDNGLIYYQLVVVGYLYPLSCLLFVVFFFSLFFLPWWEHLVSSFSKLRQEQIFKRMITFIVEFSALFNIYNLCFYKEIIHNRRCSIVTAVAVRPF